MKALRRIALASSITGLIVLIWLLAESRPVLPSTHQLTNASGTQRLINLAAWLGALLFAAGLLARAVARVRRGTRTSPISIHHLHSVRAVSTLGLTSSYPTHAFPIMLRPLGKAEAIAEPASARAGRDQKPENRAETPPPPEAVQIAVLGPLAITGGRKQRRKLRGATRELLAYLALHPNGAQRDQIIDALWPDQTPEQGRNRLWRAAADARNHLGETVISRDNDRYQLDRAQVSVDLDRLEELLSEISSDDHAETSLARLEDALKLFAGEPLAGLEFAWAESEQRRLQAVQLDLRERAGRLLLTTGDAASALAHAERGLSFEPYNEKLSRVAMEAEAALGLRKPVIQRYARLREILDEQLGLEPHTETKTLYRRLLAQDNADYPGHCDPDPVKGRR